MKTIEEKIAILTPLLGYKPVEGKKPLNTKLWPLFVGLEDRLFEALVAFAVRQQNGGQQLSFASKSFATAIWFLVDHGTCAVEAWELCPKVLIVNPSMKASKYDSSYWRTLCAHAKQMARMSTKLRTPVVVSSDDPRFRRGNVANRLVSRGGNVLHVKAGHA